MLELTINPQIQIKQKSTLDLKFNLSKMPRLSLVDNSGVAKGNFVLKNIHHGLTITVKVNAMLPMVCERCLGVTKYSIQTENTLLIVSCDTDKRCDTHDCVILEDDKLSLIALAEDELLLNLPLFVKHDSSDCMLKATKMEKTIKTYKPFANLNKLR